MRKLSTTSTARSCCAFLALLQPAQALLNISVTDQSPMIIYNSPSSVNHTYSGNASWIVQYTGTQQSAWDPDQLKAGAGTSSHWTEAPQAVISINFSGDGIYAWGNITTIGGGYDPTEGGSGGSYMTVNGQTYASNDTNGCLGYATELGQGWHTATLEYKGSGRITFTGFTLSLDLGGDLGNNTIDVQGSNGPQSINQAFSLSANDWGLGDVSTSPNNISEILTTHPYASLSFEVPSNTSAVILWGNVSPVDGNYSVTLSSPTLNDVQQTASSLTPPANQTFLQPVDSMSPWQGINVIQYLRVINPNTTHTIRVDKLSDGGYAYGLNSVTLISATNTTVPNDPGNGTGGGGGDDSGGSSGSGVDAGAIAGGVVGGLAALTIIIGLIWFFVRRKKRRAMTVKPADVSAFHVDENGYADRDHSLRPEAFPIDAETAYSQAAGGTDDSTLNTMTEKQAALLADHTPPNGTATPQMTSTHPTPTTMPATLTISRSSPAQPPALRLANPSHNPSQSATDSTPPRTPSDEPKPPGAAPTPSTARRRRRPAERELVQEVDAGRVEPHVERLPPSYDPTWSRRGEDDGADSA